MSCSTCSESNLSSNSDYQYASKIVCGIIKETPPKGRKHNPLPAGEYYTKINIHNPSRCDCVTFRWKVALGEPGLKVGPISEFSEVTLCADEALEIDCGDIIKRLSKDCKGHIEGWVVIESPMVLDIVSVYGTSDKANGKVNAFHTERVPARMIAKCEHFHLNINTGIAAWQVKGPEPISDVAYTQATIGSLSSGKPALNGTLWAHTNSTDHGEYTYRLQFKLCTGFKNPVLTLCSLADYSAKFYLNGVQFGATPSPGFNTPCTSLTTNNSFQSGMNELTVVVTNLEDESPTGLDIQGYIEVENGKCAGDPNPLLQCPKVCYRTWGRHFVLLDKGNGWWSNWACNGTTSGTVGQHRRIEGIQLSLSNAPAGSTLEYRVHQEQTGWSSWCPEGAVCGNINIKHRLEAIEVRLVNSLCHIRYRVHMKNKWGSGGGWSSWVADGATAGTTGQHRRIEAIEIVID